MQSTDEDNAATEGEGGNVIVSSGTSNVKGGNVEVSAGSTTDSDEAGGMVQIGAGESLGSGPGGAVSITSGRSAEVAGGSIAMRVGNGPLHPLHAPLRLSRVGGQIHQLPLVDSVE